MSTGQPPATSSVRLQPDFTRQFLPDVSVPGFCRSSITGASLTSAGARCGNAVSPTIDRRLALAPEELEDDREVARDRVVSSAEGRQLEVLLDFALGVDGREVVELHPDPRLRQPRRQVDDLVDRQIQR